MEPAAPAGFRSEIGGNFVVPAGSPSSAAGHGLFANGRLRLNAASCFLLLPVVPARPPETFATVRLLARPVRASDAAQAFTVYASDPVATRFLSFPTYKEVAPLEEFFRTREQVWQSDKIDHLPWALVLRETPDQLIGSIGISLTGSQALFGYVIGRAYWGRGLVAEALTWLVYWSLAQPEIFRAWAFCDAENTASARVMEKAGITREGLLRRWHPAPNIGPEPRDCFIYAKVR